MIMGMSRLAKSLIVWAVVLCAQGAAFGALPAKPGSISNAPKHYVAYAIGLVLVGGVSVAAFKASKRTHLD